MKLTIKNNTAHPSSHSFSHRISKTPKELWIELTSRCPFKCIFCSRELLRKKGEHMDFELYKSLIASLDSPHIIRLNYSGESIHYPKIIEAISLAKSTGASVELVSALSSIKEKNIPLLVKSGLDRLTISIHTTDNEQYQQIYGFGSIKLLTKRLHELKKWQTKLNSNKPSLDFAFVAMQRNINQLSKISELAQCFDINHIDIHPIIRRDDIQERFELELNDNKLKPQFLKLLTNTINQVKKNYPSINYFYSTPEPEQAPESQKLSYNPIVYPWKLSGNAHIWSCDQNPWDTIHILSNGDVVSCEVRDQIVLGNLRNNNLNEIWHGNTYNIFRKQYHTGLEKTCNHCPYKMVYLPSKPLPYIGPKVFNVSQLIIGWYTIDDEIVWSRMDASIVLSRPKKSKYLKLKALLPCTKKKNRTLTIKHLNKIIAIITNSSNQMLFIDQVIKIKENHDDQTLLHFSVTPEYIPTQESDSTDSRSLGFALQSLTWHD